MEVFVYFISDDGLLRGQDRATAFPTSDGGRAFQEAVGGLWLRIVRGVWAILKLCQ